MPQIKCLSILSAGLGTYGMFSHSMGGAVGTFSRCQQKAFAVKSSHYLQYLVNIGNVLLDTTNKDLGCVEYRCVDFPYSSLLKWLSVAFSFTSALVSQEPSVLGNCNQGYSFPYCALCRQLHPAAWVAINKHFSFLVLYFAFKNFMAWYVIFVWTCLR